VGVGRPRRSNAEESEALIDPSRACGGTREASGRGRAPKASQRTVRWKPVRLWPTCGLSECGPHTRWQGTVCGEGVSVRRSSPVRQGLEKCRLDRQRLGPRRASPKGRPSSYGLRPHGSGGRPIRKAQDRRRRPDRLAGQQSACARSTIRPGLTSPCRARWLQYRAFAA
jgi:hypothetical protein